MMSRRPTPGRSKRRATTLTVVSVCTLCFFSFLYAKGPDLNRYFILFGTSRAQLPPPGICGRLAHVKDDVRGIWMDQGEQWFHVNGEVVDVKEFGARGDDNTPDGEAIQSAIDVLAETGRNGGTVLFPPGRYRIDSTLVIPPGMTGLTLKGSGASFGGSTGAHENDATWLIQDGTGPLLLAPETVSFLTITDLAMGQVDAQSPGDLILIEDSVRFLAIERVNFALANPASSFFRKVGQGSHLAFRGIRGRMAEGAFSPAVSISVGPDPGNVFQTQFENIMINSDETATAPIFYLEDLGPGVPSMGYTFRNVTLEVPGGGGIELRSPRQALLQGVVTADLTTTPSQPLILIDRGDEPGSLAAQDVILLGCRIINGDATAPSVRFASAPSQKGLVIIGSEIQYLESSSAPVIIGSARVSNIVGDTRPLWVKPGGRITGVEGISATNLETRNLRGSLVIADGAASGTVSFDHTEPDADYFVTVTAVGVAGTPVAGSNRVLSIEKLEDGFTVQLEAAPGPGNGVELDWHLIR